MAHPAGRVSRADCQRIRADWDRAVWRPIVTAGGLVFVAAAQDEKLRAFDKATGKLLWEAKLPAAGYATPSTYAVGGRQFVVIAAGGGKLGSKSSDTYVAFALPR